MLLVHAGGEHHRVHTSLQVQVQRKQYEEGVLQEGLLILPALVANKKGVVHVLYVVLRYTRLFWCLADPMQCQSYSNYANYTHVKVFS